MSSLYNSDAHLEQERRLQDCAGLEFHWPMPSRTRMLQNQNPKGDSHSRGAEDPGTVIDECIAVHKQLIAVWRQQAILCSPDCLSQCWGSGMCYHPCLSCDR